MLRRFLLIWHCCLYPQGWAVQLTTNAIYKQESDIAKLQCIEKGLLGTQLQWQKHLQTNLSDYVTVANTAAVLTPFSATGRYSATYNETNGRTSFIVTIKELRIEDSGVYECVTDSGESKRKLQLHVVVPVQYVELLGALNSSETIQRISSQPSDPLQNVTNFLQRHLTYDVRHAGIVECMAYGGNPQPHVRIFVGIDEISVQGSNMQQSRTSSLEGTTRGLQWYNFSVRQYSYNFRLAPRADGQLMRCVGDVDEKRDSKSASAMLTVLGEPFVTEELCDNQTTIAEAHRVNISCEFYCNPACGRLTWNGTGTAGVLSVQGLDNNTVEHFDTQDSNVFIEKLSDELYVTHLEVAIADEVGSHIYELTLHNEVGDISQNIRLDVVRLLTQLPPIEKPADFTIAIILGSLLMVGVLAGSIHVSIMYYKHRKQANAGADEIELDMDDIPADTRAGRHLSTVYDRRHSVQEQTSETDSASRGDHRRSTVAHRTVGDPHKLNAMSQIIREECETMHAHQEEEDSEVGDYMPRYGHPSRDDRRRPTGFNAQDRRRTTGFNVPGRRRTTGFNGIQARRPTGMNQHEDRLASVVEAQHGERRPTTTNQHEDRLASLVEQQYGALGVMRQARQSTLGRLSEGRRPTAATAATATAQPDVHQPNSGAAPEVRHPTLIPGPRSSVATGGPSQRRVRRTTILL